MNASRFVNEISEQRNDQLESDIVRGEIRTAKQ